MVFVSTHNQLFVILLSPSSHLLRGGGLLFNLKVWMESISYVAPAANKKRESDYYLCVFEKVEWVGFILKLERVCSMILHHIYGPVWPAVCSSCTIINVITTVIGDFDYSGPKFLFWALLLLFGDEENQCVVVYRLRKCEEIGMGQDNKLSTRYTACICSLNIHYIRKPSKFEHDKR